MRLPVRRFSLKITSVRENSLPLSLDTKLNFKEKDRKKKKKKKKKWIVNDDDDRDYSVGVFFNLCLPRGIP